MGDVSVNVTGGSVSGGTGRGGTGVVMFSPASTYLVNAGTIGALSGYAVYAEAGKSAKLENSGTINGYVELSTAYDYTHGGLGSRGDRAVMISNTGVVSGGLSLSSESVLMDNRAGGLINGGAWGGGVSIYATRSAHIINAGTLDFASRFLAGSAGTSIKIDNTGTVAGSMFLFGGSVEFNNYASGVFNAGEMVSFLVPGPVGAPAVNGTLNNHGIVRVGGGTGELNTTSLAGHYVQSPTGSLHVRADFGTGAADRLEVDGTATIAGTVVVKPFDVLATHSLHQGVTVMTATGGITNIGLTNDGLAPLNTGAIRYSLHQPDANTLSVQATINFQGSGNKAFSANENAVGGNLNGIFSGGTTLGFMPALLNLPTAGGLGNALSQLSPAGDGGGFSSAMTTGNTFANQMLSCRVAGEEGEVNRYVREGQCVWARITARRFDLDGGTDGPGVKEKASFFSAGAQLKVVQDWRIGGGIGYETTDLTAGNATSQGERLHLGAVVKYNPGPWLLAASVNGGQGWNDNVRRIGFGGFGALATSSNDSSFISGRITAAYLMSRGIWYLKPQVELSATNLSRDGYTESGSGGVALRVASSEASVLSVSPSLELGAEQRFESGVARLFVRGGATFRDSETFVATATFAHAPAGTSPFAISSRIDRVTADIGAGLDVIGNVGSALRLQYDGQFGDRTTSHSGSGKVSLPF